MLPPLSLFKENTPLYSTFFNKLINLVIIYFAYLIIHLYFCNAKHLEKRKKINGNLKTTAYEKIYTFIYDTVCCSSGMCTRDRCS